MDIQKAKDLAYSIIQKGSIKDTEAQKILKLLKPQELSMFLRVLKQENKKNTVVVTSSEELSTEIVKNLRSLFKKQNIVKDIDPKIGAGIVIQDYDMIYDLSVRSEIKRLAQQVQNEI